MPDPSKSVQQAKPRDNAAFLALARDRFRMCEEAESKNRAAALDDLRFFAVDQWPDHIRKQREDDKRPCLELDRLGQFVRQVTNEIRKNIPGIEVGPVDSNGDPDTAEVIEGTIRHIEYISNASVAKVTAAEYAAIMGFGYYRLRADYCDPMSMDQDILFESVKNPFSVYLDPAAQKPDRSDAQFGFIVTRMPIEQHKRDFPNSEVSSASDFTGLGDRAPNWFFRNEVAVAEYYYIEWQEATLAKLKTGESMLAEEVPEGAIIVRTRKTKLPRVKWAKINGVEILEEQTLPGTIIPIIGVYGDELIVDGELILRGVVRTAKSAQQQYNFMASAETEAIALAPRAPYIIAEGQTEGYEHMWETANTRTWSYLVYRPKVLTNDHVAPAPQRQTFEPAIQAISQARMQAAADMQAATAMYPAALGDRSNETSGKAILARQRESDNANFHFGDNVKRADRKAYKILLEWIPVYYGPDRVIRIIGAEGEQKTIRTGEAQPAAPGVEQIYDLSVGKYDVVFRSGPSASTKREVAVEAMGKLIQAYPNIMQVAGDLLVENMDFPGARALAERLKKTLPPELVEDDKQKPIPPQVQATLNQQGQMIEQLVAELNQVSEEVRTKKYELDSKKEVEFARLELEREKLNAEVRLELAKMGSQEDLALLKAELTALQQKFEALLSVATAEHQQDQAERDQQNLERQQQRDSQQEQNPEVSPEQQPGA